MEADITTDVLASELADALAMLEDYRQDGANAVAEPLPSLLEQCQALCEDFSPPEPVRSLHHLACSGGTLISKCIAALPNVVLLSEIDPLSRMEVANLGEKPKFAPTDVIHALNHANRKVDDEIRIAAFRASIDSVLTGLERRGMRMVLRDHPHSQFHTGADHTARPTVLEILSAAFPTLSLVSVRHPLDTYLALANNGWIGFKPDTLEEYSLRTMAFLNRHESSPLIKYEQFIADPEGQLERICQILSLPYEPLALDMIGAVRISGDSGRSSPVISARPRRPVPEAVESQRSSEAYTVLCEKLDYEP
jgi:hypothetical protein